MTSETAEVVICGAGIAGISAAYHLAVKHGVKDVWLVDERAPLSLTSDKSTECYRNWWPGPGDGMVRLMNRSIDILEEMADSSGNAFHMNRRGYLFATADPARVADLRAQGEEAAALGAGPLRIHDGQTPGESYQPAGPSGYHSPLTGADLITDKDLIRAHFPYLAKETVAVIHARRCGWFSAQQMGMLMLERARSAGVRFVSGRVTRVDLDGARVCGVRIEAPAGERRVSTRHFVNAAGPFLKPVAALLGVDLPVFSELHIKISIKDRLGLFPREAPLLIWSDPQRLPWRAEERAEIEADPQLSHLLEEFPQGVHARPEGPADSPIVLILWTYDTQPVEPTFPPTFDPQYPEIALRGLATMLPALEAYFDRPPRPTLDGGYYTKTEENRPLVGPLPVEGAWVIGALSGFGLMASPACGELIAKHICGAELPPYARWFLLSRYDDPRYRSLLKDWGRSGQL